MMYSYSFSRYVWYDLENRTWIDVKGLEVLRKYRSFSIGFRNYMVELVNYHYKKKVEPTGKTVGNPLEKAISDRKSRR